MEARTRPSECKDMAKFYRWFPFDDFAILTVPRTKRVASELFGDKNHHVIGYVKYQMHEAVYFMRNVQSLT